MHGSMHNSILVKALSELQTIGVRIIPPRDAYGKHNLPDDATLVKEVIEAAVALKTRR
jgi:phosphopantothenoylcysteine decarboxylase/phosphopantothenate--cysteine ligase